MLRLLADENFNNHIWKAVLRRLAQVDFVRAQDVGLTGCDDPAVLEWAAVEGRLLLTHDVRTIHRFVEERLLANQPVPGVIFVPQPFSAAAVISDLLLLIQCSSAQELTHRVFTYLPLS